MNTGMGDSMQQTADGEHIIIFFVAFGFKFFFLLYGQSGSHKQHCSLIFLISLRKFLITLSPAKGECMQRKQLKYKASLAILTLTLLLSFAPVCHAADNATNFNTICNWLEINLPDYFSPKAETFETSGFLIRYYQNTNTYVGTINGDFYVLGGAFGNEVVYVGTNEYLLNLISPPETNSFVKTFGGTDDDSGESVQQTADGGFIIAGQTQSSGSGNYDVYLLKTDSSGNETWAKTFGGTEWDEANSVQQTTDGGFIIVGYTLSFGAGGGDVYLIKTDSSGNETWAKTFGGTGYDYGSSVQQTTDGGFIITGYTESYGFEEKDVYLIKTDSNGNETWARIFRCTDFGGTKYHYGESVQQTTDGGFIIAGSRYTWSNDTGSDKDIYLLKTDSNGNEIWAKTFGGTEWNEGYSVQQTTDGGFIIAGRTSYRGNYEVNLIKTDSSGNEIWSKTFGSTGYDSGSSVQRTTDGGYIIAGYTNSYDRKSDVYLIKTDSSGNETWSKTFGGTDGDSGSSVQQTTDGGYIIAGFTKSFGAGNGDVYLLKTDSNGN